MEGQVYQEWGVGISLKVLPPPQFCVWFPRWYAMNFFVFCDLRWVVIVRFVDIIVDNHFLNFLFIIYVFPIWEQIGKYPDLLVNVENQHWLTYFISTMDNIFVYRQGNVCDQSK